MVNFDMFQNYDKSTIPRKEWYLFGESTYLGPYSYQEVANLIEQEKVEVESYKIWSHEIKHWKSISSIPHFQHVISNLEKSKKLGNAKKQYLSIFGKNNNSSLYNEDFYHFDENNQLTTSKTLVNNSSNDKLYKNHRILLAFSVGVLLSVGIGLGLNYNYKLSHPQLVTDIAGVSKQENREIKAAISDPLILGETSGAIGIIKKDGQAPLFVIGSNQSDGWRFKIKIEGVPETLIGGFRFSTQAILVLKNGLARSQSLLSDDGKPVPVGEYKVSLICESCNNLANVAEKIYFIGGIKNIEYDLQLRQYHEILRKQVREELSEAKLLTETLERELIEISTQFEEVLANKSITKWESFTSKWQSMHEQVGEIVNKFDMQNNQSKVFYSEIFAMLKTTFETIGHAYAIQNKYIDTMNTDSKDEELLTNILTELDANISSENSTAQSSLLSIRNKIKIVERLPLSTNGMPRVE